MESKDLIIIICAIIVGACIIAFAIAFADDIHDDEDDTVSTNCTAENLTNNTTANTSDNTKPNSGVYVVSEVVKYNYQADDGSYYREVTYSDGGLILCHKCKFVERQVYRISGSYRIIPVPS